MNFTSSPLASGHSSGKLVNDSLWYGCAVGIHNQRRAQLLVLYNFSHGFSYSNMQRGFQSFLKSLRLTCSASIILYSITSDSARALMQMVNCITSSLIIFCASKQMTNCWVTYSIVWGSITLETKHFILNVGVLLIHVAGNTALVVLQSFPLCFLDLTLLYDYFPL